MMALCFDPRKQYEESKTYEADVNRGRRIASEPLPDREREPIADAMQDATDLCGYFCAKNSLPLPATTRRQLKFGTLGHCGSSKDRETFLVEVSLDQIQPGQDPREHTSVLGVLAHEVGHMAHDRLGFGTGARLDRVLRSEDPINSYEETYRCRPDFVSEAMAESISVFVRTPQWLRDERPRRWDLLVQYLKPVFEMPVARPRPEDWDLGDGLLVSSYGEDVVIQADDLEVSLSPEVMEKLVAYAKYAKAFRG